MLKRTAALPAALLLAVSAFAATPEVKFEKYKLKNGLTVILAPDASVPVVTTYVLYKVGARSEQKGRTGFAHLFEHMMFQGSANAPKGVHFKTVESNGGNLNGSTHPDFTDYFEVLPSNKLAVALWLESDRMRSLAITDENLKNQKEAVKQERRLSFDNRPYVTALTDKWYALTFENFSNSHSLIGSFEDLNNASTDDVAAFFKTFYAPNNAVLTIVGDIKIPEARKLVEEYFGDIAPQEQPPRPDTKEPERPGKSAVHKDPLARVPGVVVGFPGPKRRSPDYYALVMADVILSGGDSSRLQLNLVKGKQSVIQYQANLGFPYTQPSDYVDPGLYGIFLLHNPAVPADQIVEQAQQELDKLAKEPVDAKELERARLTVRADRIQGLQSSMGRARLLSLYEYLDGDPSLITKELDQMLAVTPAQIQDVARRYFQPAKRFVLEVSPAPPAAAKPQPK